MSNAVAGLRDLGRWKLNTLKHIGWPHRGQTTGGKLNKDNVILGVIKQQRIAVLITETNAAYISYTPRLRIRRVHIPVAPSTVPNNPTQILIINQRNVITDPTNLIPF